MKSTKNQPGQGVVALLLIVAITVYRLIIGFQPGHLPWLENFAPVAAVALCGGVYLPRRMALVVPLVAMFISDLPLNWHYGEPLVSPQMISRYVAMAMAVGIGFAIRGRARIWAVLPASLLGSLIFYVVTNTSSWMTLPYAKSLAGWLQALTSGLPGYPPTWMFFRSTIISDLLFTGIFVACMEATREPEPEEAQAPEPEEELAEEGAKA